MADGRRKDTFFMLGGEAALREGFPPQATAEPEG
jgi:hypothetical protein